MKIGHKLAELRGKLKFSQQEVSDKLNIKQGTYNKWENNATTPSSKYLPKLAKVLILLFMNFIHKKIYKWLMLKLLQIARFNL